MADGEMAVIFCDKSAGFSMTVLVAGAMYGTYGKSAFNEYLCHETRHFPCPPVVGGIIVNQANVAGALEETVKIIGVDRCFV